MAAGGETSGEKAARSVGAVGGAPTAKPRQGCDRGLACVSDTIRKEKNGSREDFGRDLAWITPEKSAVFLQVCACFSLEGKLRGFRTCIPGLLTIGETPKWWSWRRRKPTTLVRPVNQRRPVAPPPRTKRQLAAIVRWFVWILLALRPGWRCLTTEARFARRDAPWVSSRPVPGSRAEWNELADKHVLASSEPITLGSLCSAQRGAGVREGGRFLALPGLQAQVAHCRISPGRERGTT